MSDVAVYDMTMSVIDEVFDLLVTEDVQVSTATQETEVYDVAMSVLDEVFDIGVVEEQSIDVELSTAIQIVSTNPYDGEYVVTPKAHESTILETKYKTMADDVTVLKVPYYETSNITGETVYIASEV